MAKLSAHKMLSETVAAPAGELEKIVHNRNGQRLGRKGRETRERILRVASELIETEDAGAITLKSVANSAGISMGSIYIYFNDLSELVLALLEQVFETANERYLDMLNERWNEEEIGPKCLEFVTRLYGFWLEHGKLLALRNQLSGQPDFAMLKQRVQEGRRVITLLLAQMEPSANSIVRNRPDEDTIRATATILYTGIERTCSLHTDGLMQKVFLDNFAPDKRASLCAEARLMSTAIRDCRGQISIV